MSVSHGQVRIDADTPGERGIGLLPGRRRVRDLRWRWPVGGGHQRHQGSRAHRCGDTHAQPDNHLLWVQGIGGGVQRNAGWRSKPAPVARHQQVDGRGYHIRETKESPVPSDGIRWSPLCRQRAGLGHHLFAGQRGIVAQPIKAATHPLEARGACVVCQKLFAIPVVVGPSAGGVAGLLEARRKSPAASGSVAFTSCIGQIIHDLEMTIRVLGDQPTCGSQQCPSTWSNRRPTLHQPGGAYYWKGPPSRR